MRLIDADALEKTGIPFDTHGGATFIALGSVRTAPTIEAEPVRHGVWVIGDYYDIGDVCSECGWDSGMVQLTFRYCPNCGAKMQGGSDE